VDECGAVYKDIFFGAAILKSRIDDQDISLFQSSNVLGALDRYAMVSRTN